MTSFDSVKSSLVYVFDEASGLINHSIDYVAPYIDSNSVPFYVDSEQFRSAVSGLMSGVENEVGSRINNAINGFNIRVSNIGSDFGSSLTSDQMTEFTSLVQAYGERLIVLSNSITTKSNELVTSHAMDRPLLRLTGTSDVPTSISFVAPNVFRYEFQNVGKKPWSGWMNIKLVDNYKKKVVVDYAPPNLVVIAPGETAMLSRESPVPKIQYVDGNPRTWGSSTTIYVSIHTRI